MSQITPQVKAAIRAGFAWPGGYRLNVIMQDGATICADCARAEWRRIARSAAHSLHDGWAPAGAEIHREGPAEVCAHCGKELPSEYGE